jgi:hypothetical protein
MHFSINPISPIQSKTIRLIVKTSNECALRARCGL